MQNTFPLSSIFDYSTSLDQSKLLFLLTILAVSIFFLWYSNYYHFPPGPWGYPIVGHLNLFKHKPHIRLTHLRDKYGDIFQLSLGKHRAVVVSSFTLIQDALLKQWGRLCDRPSVFSSQLQFHVIKDAGITFTDISPEYDIKKFFVRQSIDNLCLTHDSIENVLAEEVEKFILLMVAHTESFDPNLTLETTFLRLMMYLVNGKMYEPNDKNFLEIWKTYQIRHNITGDISGFLPIIKQLSAHQNEEVSERLRLQLEYQRDIVNRHKDCFNPDILCDLTDHMLVMLERNEDCGLLDHEQLDALLVELSGSGHRALSVTLRWLLLYVASFPEVQEKAYKELMSVVGKDHLPRLIDQSGLPYTCAVIMETHRLASVMPFLYPHKASQDATLNDYDLPKDSVLLFNIWSLNHDPKLWKQPMKFDPSRFLTEDGVSLSIPDHFLPFGAGVRTCPGETLAHLLLFVFSSHILHQLHLSLPNKVELDGIYHNYILSPRPFKITARLRETTEYSSLKEVEKLEKEDGLLLIESSCSDSEV